jgi:hypothetical protein
MTDLSKIARTNIERKALSDADGWVAYGLTKTFDECLEAIEHQRKLLYGYET